ncbi:MAG: hydroxyisourate hydrolase [Acidobacteria bacterium]|nr:MAG: hydroxyisourate hydrolase [Acidobacteriota bacterium]
MRPLLGRFLASLVAVTVVAASGSLVAQPRTELSTITMDAVSGKAAVGLRIELYEVSSEKPRQIAEAVTGEDGRAVLLKAGPIPPATYELRFQTAEYFLKEGVSVGDPPALDYVVVRFTVTDPAGHYHVPLIFTPWGYTTYRGS